MLSIFTPTMFFSIDHQSTSNDRLKPVMTTGLANMHIDRSIANLGNYVEEKKFFCKSLIWLLEKFYTMEISKLKVGIFQQ